MSGLSAPAHGLALSCDEFGGRPRSVCQNSWDAACQEVAARDELLLLNIELSSTRESLKESSRADERLRIARELHDVL